MAVPPELTTRTAASEMVAPDTTPPLKIVAPAKPD